MEEAARDRGDAGRGSAGQLVLLLRGGQHPGDEFGSREACATEHRAPSPEFAGRQMRAARRSGIELLEESVGLLRRAPSSAWAWYLAGAVSFFGAALIFWSRMTGVTAAPDPMGGALLLAVLF